MNTEKIKIIPLGGLGGIGKNITLFEYNDEIIIVDCGIMFPTEGMPGIDYIIPDFSYLKTNKNKIKGLILTHGHEDHIGAVSFLLQEISVPIYATKLTLGLVQSRLEERPAKEEPLLHEVQARDVVHIGSFVVEFIKVNHSIIDGMGLAIQTDVGTIIHTGDFKIDFSPVDNEVTDISRFTYYGDHEVLLLMSDSTNAEVKGYTKSETLLFDTLVRMFSSAKGRVIIATFASNIHRIQQVLDVAYRYNRKVAISGISMLKNIEIAHTLGYLKFKDDLIIDLEETKNLPDKKIVIIGTGSQGEPMSAITRMANGTHKNIYVKKGDTVIITASIIPGNERTVNTIINTLMKLGATVYHEKEEDIHVSGHGSAEELKLMITLTRPKFFMPIHGEYKHMKAHAGIAETLKVKPSRILIADNGDVLELTKKNFKKINKIKLATTYVDSGDIGEIDNDLIKDRIRMATDGFLSVVLIIAQGMLMRSPVFIQKGVTLFNEKLIKSMQNSVEAQTKKMLSENKSLEDIQFTIKKSVKSHVLKMTRQSPLITVEVLEV